MLHYVESLPTSIYELFEINVKGLNRKKLFEHLERSIPNESFVSEFRVVLIPGDSESAQVNFKWSPFSAVPFSAENLVEANKCLKFHNTCNGFLLKIIK